jgi:DNA-binding CsgD family transcriptional regulator
MTDDQSALLDRIYEAGAIPELWPNVLAELDSLTGSAGSALVAVRGGTSNWIASPAFEDLAAGYFERGYAGRDERTVQLLAHQHDGFLGEHDVFAPGAWESDPIRLEYWVPRGLGWGLATHIAVPNGDALIFHSERRLADGPVDRATIARMDVLRPHLARAALLTNRLSFERVQAAVGAFELIGLPAAVLDQRGQALVTNARLDALVPEVIQARATRLGFVRPGADQLLQEAIETMPRAQSATHSIPLQSDGAHLPMVAHLHPVRGVARDILSRATSILVITQVGDTDAPSEAVIRGLFDLTAAEARVARGLATGMAVDEIAGQHGTRVTTVRNQVRSIFLKTGVRRQAEFVGLLRGLGSGQTPSGV